MIYLVLSFILSCLLMGLSEEAMIKLLGARGIAMRNYRDRQVINSGGLLFLLPSIGGILPFYFSARRQDVLVYILTIISTAFAGYLDDSLGDDSVKGFRGHIGALREGKLTTGIIKILTALLIGAIISRAYSYDAIHFMINLIQFGLCINFINLLDLRPGRAIKGFIGLALLMSVMVGFRGVWLLLPVMGCLIIYFKDELNEKVMLGDTGSNLLGGILGLYSVMHNTLGGSVFFTASLILLHLLSEFKSFTAIIDSTPLLRYIDDIGRGRGEERQ